MEALDSALCVFGCSEIFNTDQGSQFTSKIFTSCLLGSEIQISMDGKSRRFDNIFIEPLWRSLKYEAALEGIGNLIVGYNEENPHKSLNGLTPAMVYSQGVEQL